MSQNLLLPLALCCAVFCSSCSKDDDPLTCEETPFGDDGIDAGDMNAFPTTIGSYWVYDLYDVDENGVETLTASKDSIYVYGDSIVNGNTFTVFKTTFLGSGEHYSLLRDSSGFIINPQGFAGHSYLQFDIPLSSATYGALVIDAEMGGEELVSINVPVGTFLAWEKRTILSRNDGAPVTLCGDETYVLKEYYDPEIGLVYHELGYVGAIQSTCSHKIKKLSAFYIAP